MELTQIQKDYNLTSYKLDSVASHFIKGQINEIEICDEYTTIKTKNTYMIWRQKC